MNIDPLLDEEISIRDFVEKYGGLYEMAHISTFETGQKYDFWSDPAGHLRNVPHGPRVKVEFEKGTLVPVSLSRNPKIYSNRKYTGKGVTDILKFIGEHYVALKLHFDGKWRDAQLLRYFTLVGRKHMSIPEALKDMLEDGDITEIPKEFGN